MDFLKRTRLPSWNHGLFYTQGYQRGAKTAHGYNERPRILFFYLFFSSLHASGIAITGTSSTAVVYYNVLMWAVSLCHESHLLFVSFPFEVMDHIDLPGILVILRVLVFKFDKFSSLYTAHIIWAPFVIKDLTSGGLKKHSWFTLALSPLVIQPIHTG